MFINTKATAIGFNGNQIRLMPGAQLDPTPEQLAVLRADPTIRALVLDGHVLDPAHLLDEGTATDARSTAWPMEKVRIPQPPPVVQVATTPTIVEPAAPVVKAVTPDVPKATELPATLAGIKVADVGALIDGCSDLAVLKAWFDDETRVTVRNMINARGSVIVNAAAPSV